MLKDITGNRYGRLLVLKLNRAENRRSYWDCKCDCGNVITTRSDALKGGDARSCGCLQKEKAKANGLQNKTHGKSKSRLYYVWMTMHRRCDNENTKSYKRYGGRGISVCKDWDSYVNFAIWAYDNGYDDIAERGVLTIDRINNDGNYCPENCRFVSTREQARNTSANTILSYAGESHPIVRWAEITGIKGYVISLRITRLKWSVERALTEPVHKITRRNRGIGTSRARK